VKTYTEILGIPLREIYAWRSELVHAKRGEKKGTPVPPVQSPLEPKTEVQALPSDPAHIKTPDERVAELEQRRREASERRKQEWRALVGEIKDPLITKIKEKFQWTDDKAGLALEALDLVDRQRVGDLRRVVIWKLEKPDEILPKYGKKIGEFFYTLDYLPPRVKPERPGMRGEKRGGRGKRGKRGPQGAWRKEGSRDRPRSAQPRAGFKRGAGTKA